MSRASLVVLAVVWTSLSPSPALATISDPDLEETVVATLPRVVTSFAWPPDGSNRLFVLRQTGQIRIVEDGVLLPTPFATVAPIYTVDECGLLGITFDPDFVNNGYVYVFVTVSASEQQIVRYTAKGNLGEEPTVIVAGLPTLGVNHDGGAIGFGPDGNLYWAIGDNGSYVGTKQDLTSLAAKVGRAHRDGAVPVDNPFFDGSGPNNDYIWARGFRNPFTMTFQPATGELWLNVVGRAHEQVFSLRAGDHGGWDSYEVNQPAGYVPARISYRTDKTEAFPIGAATGVVRAAGVVTLTTTANHAFRPGAKVTVAGATDATFNGTAYVTSVLSTRRLTFQQAGPDSTSGGGTVSSQLIGGCVAGGTFWDSSAAPSSLRGNFLFGDYNSGRLMLASLDAQNQVVAVDEWGSDITSIIDLSIGPDGDLYYASTRGSIGRVRYKAAGEGLVVSALNVRLLEGGAAAFNVRLSGAPSGGSRSVSVTRSGGDEDVTIAEGDELTFDASNWAVPQRVLLAAASDPDVTDDAAEILVSTSGLDAQRVVARVTDAVVAGGQGPDTEPEPSAGSGGAPGEPSGTGGLDTEGIAGADGGINAVGGVGDAGDAASAAGGAPKDAAIRASSKDANCSCRAVGLPHNGGFAALLAAGCASLLGRRAARTRAARDR